jgi:two-component system sensor histidine kinase BaeS
MRSSLLTRLLAVSVLVAVCSVAATAWLAARTTSGAIQQEQGQVLADDGNIYQGLLGYAATHPSWDNVGLVVATYAQLTGRRVALTTPDGKPIADSAKTSAPLPKRPSVVLDPLSVDSGLAVVAAPDRIAAEAVGPFALPDGERQTLQDIANRVVSCLQERVGIGSVTTSPTGRPKVVSPDPYLISYCGGYALDKPTPTEQRAMQQLSTLVGECLSRRGQPEIGLLPDFTWIRKGVRSGESEQAIQACVTAGRREQLTPFVAPAALLYITSPAGDAPTGFTLSQDNELRLAGVAGAVLLLSIAVTVLAGVRLIRPLRALTGAAQRMGAGAPSTRVEVKGRDEIGRLAEAFNDMSESRDRLEQNRKAMVSDIAHELRTPLSNIRGWLEATQDGVSRLDDELVGSLLEEALHLQHIVDDLQDLALADAGTLRVHPEPLDANLLLNQVAAAHTPRALAAGVALSVHPAADPELSADPVRLRQALDNLVSNAIRHTPPGETVSLHCGWDGDEVAFEVADTGVGIGPEDLPHVFDRFWRADPSRNRRSGGSGLGLAIVRKLVQAHGGTVTAASVLGQGSTFTVRLPAIRAAGPARTADR